MAAGTETGDLGLVAPELQITTTATVTSYANFMHDRIEESDALATFRPGYSAELALADNPQALVDRLNLVMMAGAIEPATRDNMIAAITSVPLRAGSEPQDRRRRVNAAMLLAVLSSEYYTQR